MTSVYGVTFMGAREQIWNRLKERKAFESGPEGKATAMYAARKVMEALGSMFENAKGVMDWLNECAKIIAYNGACPAPPGRTPLSPPVSPRQGGLLENPGGAARGAAVPQALQALRADGAADLHRAVRALRRAQPVL